MARTRMERPIEYRDRQRRVWYVSQVARLEVVSAAIDGPNLCLVIRFERDGEERFARWIGGEDWRLKGGLDRLFAEAEPVNSQPTKHEMNDDTGVGPAPQETLAIWVNIVASMGPDESRVV